VLAELCAELLGALLGGWLELLEERDDDILGHCSHDVDDETEELLDDGAHVRHLA
jgi:hypothetical protein